MESRFIDEPFDEEERQLMEAVENSPDVRFPEEEERRIKSSLQEAAKVISIRMQGGRPTGNPGNGEGRRDAIPDAHQQHHPPIRERRDHFQRAVLKSRPGRQSSRNAVLTSSRPTPAERVFLWFFLLGAEPRGLDICFF